MKKTATPGAAGKHDAMYGFSLPRQTALETGESVRIRSGPLSGLCGVVRDIHDDGRCLIQVVEMGPGVLVSLSTRQVSRS
jgi:transcription antitermination factor NusG